MRITLLLISVLLACVALGKGRAWSYTMEGYVYDEATKDVLRNASLMIGEQIVTTDEKGWYTVVISGVTCDRGGSLHAIARCNEEAFGRLVVRRLFSEPSITIRTKWKQHACMDRVVFTPPCFIFRRDLFVP